MRNFWIKYASAIALAVTGYLQGFSSLRAQQAISYDGVREYQIAGITVTGISYLDDNALVRLSGLAVGQRMKIPGDATSKAVDNLWKQGLFENISIQATKIEGERIYLNIALQERPRLSMISYEGVPKSIVTKVDDELKLKTGDILTDYKIGQLEDLVKKELLDKAYLNAEVEVVKKADTLVSSGINLVVKVDKKEKVKIAEITFAGNDAVSPEAANLDFWQKVGRSFRKVGNKGNLAFPDKRLRHIMKNTKQKSALRFWKRSKYVPSEFQEDMKTLAEAYNKEGFRDFRVLGDSVYKVDEKTIGIKVNVYEGDPYYFGNVTFVGNEKYSSAQLASVMNIQKGELYNEEKFTTNLMMNPNGADIYSLYMDNGYLLFQGVPVETQVYDDTVDVEIRIMEGPQIRFNEIRLAGIQDYLLRQYPEAHITHTVLDDGDLLLAVEKFVRDKQIDVIALSTYRRNVLARMFNPSIAHKMLFHTDTPLLVMHAIK